MYVMLLVYVTSCVAYIFLESPFEFYKHVYFNGQLADIFGIFLSITSIIRGTMFAVLNILVYIVIFSSWLISKKYEQRIEDLLLKEKSDNDPEMGYCLYSKIKNITGTINGLSNGLIFIMYLEGLTYFVDCIGATSNLMTEVHIIANFLLSVSLFLCSYVLACEFHRKVKLFSDAIICNRHLALNKAK